MSRGSRLALGVVLVSVGCVAGVVGTTLVNPSPQQAAQARQAPTLPIPTATATKQVLAQFVLGPCEPSSVQTKLQPPSVSSGKRLVVTSVDAAPGVVIKPGTRLVSVSGEPLVGFVSAIPFYRDLKLGDSGVDVRALEDGLVSAGLLKSAGDTVGTEAAEVLARLNAAAGLPARGLDLAHSVAVPAGTSVVSVGVTVGQVVAADTTVLIVGTATAQATCLVPSSVRVSAGGDATVTMSGTQTKVKVVAVTPSKDNPGQQQVTVEGDGSIPSGAQIQLPEGDATPAVLTVPAGALGTSAAGKPMVRKLIPGGAQDVEVEVGPSAGGWVQVTGGGLAEGDLVELRAAA